MSELAWLLLVLPLAGAVVLLVGGKVLNKAGPLLGCATVIASFVLGLLIFLDRLNLPADERTSHVQLFDWISVGDLRVDLGLVLDPLSMTFVLLITGVGSLIHIYSIGYMSHDPDRRRFFAYLNLFVGAMLLLVLGDGFVTLYAGWEGVGLASYLLIGFWSYKRSAATAAKKAFIMNRVGDVGLAIGIFIIFKEVGTTSYAGVFASVGEWATRSPGSLTAAALLLLLGACGKSGQVPLQAWLPDAMEGPTPVSALIHAATMVTAGVYLICRAAPIYNASTSGQLLVCIVGAVTILVGCIGGCANDDIKKVLAYSTVSQIGYMFLAAGLGAGVYGLAIVHLLTHGFFKAALFLGAGSVMHAMNDDVDMRRMGGLARYMPITFGVMFCGYLAIIGFPFLSGFYSKDPIIEAAFNAGGAKGWILGLAALIGAGITAFYMTRLMLMTFFGESRWKKLRSVAEPAGREYHPHEAPLVMTLPMIVLAIGALGAGAFLAIGDRLVEFLGSSSLGEFDEEAVAGHLPMPAIVITILTLVLVAAGILIAWVFVGSKPVPVTAPERVNPLIRLARNDVGGNAVNEALFARPGITATKAAVFTDDRGIDGGVTGAAAGLAGLARAGRFWQNGFVRSYALSMLGGALLLFLALLAVNAA
ncbi:NADH-quinone oxidoreductase subunit L [Nakamurella sp. DB0629]|uniref:NADH-quinone oxidoreductase subunit L n=1 Tax=Nakamurella aerolata TaxID=1656892 RepID=A0A849A603_9ACTN|nr:NADH-quinone oxidoreductase subunit L [Nakamurella aerolata]